MNVQLQNTAIDHFQYQFLILSFQNCLDESNLKKLYMMRSAQEELLRQNNDLNEKSSFDS